MPNIKSAEKRVRITAANSARNQTYRSSLRTTIKKANISLENGSEDKNAVVRDAVKKVDKAAAKGLLHKNTAARIKSSLAKKANA